MLRQQMLAQKAHELALHYLAAYGEPGTPEAFLVKVQQMEAVFLKALNKAHKSPMPPDAAEK
ncbi:MULTISPECIES: hypothetical protein [unclassified Serratia (in: enterobacteria)]|uniref:hypothetical protein n=1 Tax=unclassified Serratia (in: enterobacteria) TaxID=2647522 RepID=UPI002ED0D8C6|nr:hypothetical protein [Serratia sp. C2(2)]MEE4449659.1 hypothetical protein [Serratia sp. C2(1)]